jgi:NitT/TauT family transport system substrate-binding protein
VRRLFSWTLLAVAVFGSACSSSSAEADGLRRVRMSLSQHISFGPLMIAQAEGYFRDEGLDVDFVATMHPEEELVALVTGDIDVRPGALHAGFLSAIAQGAPIRITAGLGSLAPDRCTYFGIILRPGLDTSGTPAIGRLRTSQDGVTRYVVSRMLARRGTTLKGIETVRLPEPVMVSSLSSGAIDAAAASEPTLSRLKTVGPIWIAAEDVVPDFQWGALMFGERLLVRERDTGLRFLRAYRRGIAKYLEGKTDRNVTIIAEGTGESPDVVRAACWLPFHLDAHINWSSVAGFQAWARSQGFMERTVTSEQAIDSGFLASDASR